MTGWAPSGCHTYGGGRSCLGSSRKAYGCRALSRFSVSPCQRWGTPPSPHPRVVFENLANSSAAMAPWTYVIRCCCHCYCHYFYICIYYFWRFFLFVFFSFFIVCRHRTAVNFGKDVIILACKSLYDSP